MVKSNTHKSFLLNLNPGDLIHGTPWNHTLDSDTIFELIDKPDGGLTVSDGPDGVFVLAWSPLKDLRGWVMNHGMLMVDIKAEDRWKKHQHGRCWIYVNDKLKKVNGHW